MGIDTFGHENTNDFKLRDAVYSSPNINAVDITNNRFIDASTNLLSEETIISVIVDHL